MLGGTLEPDYQFPWVVSVGGGGCAGVLIDERWVLTAAHCNSTYDYDDREGVSYSRTDPNNGVETIDQMDVPFASIFPHPNYNPKNLANDIMLMQLPRAFTPSPYLQPAQLPVSAVVDGQAVTYAEDVAGSMARILRGNVGAGWGGDFQTFQASSSTASLCPGDSGGGLISEVSNLPFVVGIESAGPLAGCVAPGEEFLATSVYWFRNWIRSHTGNIGVNASSDLFWTNPTLGAWAVWLMADGVSSGGPFGFIYMPSDTGVVGTGDFNGDGTSDILWQTASTRELRIWWMREGHYVGYTKPVTPDWGWTIKAVADVNGDKIADIIWQNNSTNLLYVWLMAESGQLATGASIGYLSAGWSLFGTGDFNHDGKADLLVSKKNTVTRDVAVWLLDGGSRIGLYSTNPSTIPSSYSFAGIGHLRYTADLPGPYKDDIVWRNSDGTVLLWLSAWTPGANNIDVIQKSPGSATTDWSLKQVADVTGDGYSDLVWMNSRTRDVSTWVMNGKGAVVPPLRAGGHVELGWNLVAAAPFD